jgi:hypothetical protein
MKYYYFIIIALLLSPSSFAQPNSNGVRVQAYITASGDTIPMDWLQDVEVKTKQTKAQTAYWQEYNRLRNAVYVTYPYARTAGIVITDINHQLTGITNKKQRRKIIRGREKELKKAFTDKLTNLSIYQGKVLMKLINRQTGNNCYEIIEEYKGGVNAVFWQGVAFVFGSNLKQPYNPNGKEKDMESIVQEVEKMYGYR